ncbi:Ent-kaurene synthase, partial [Sesbania bispinosa]
MKRGRPAQRRQLHIEDDAEDEGWPQLRADLGSEDVAMILTEHGGGEPRRGREPLYRGCFVVFPDCNMITTWVDKRSNFESYEEEDDSDCAPRSMCSTREFSSSSSPPSLHSRVNAWSLDSGCETDVLIIVQGTCFRLHKVFNLLSQTLLQSMMRTEKQHFPIGFDIPFPSLIEYAQNLGINIQIGSSSLEAMIKKREIELQ